MSETITKYAIIDQVGLLDAVPSIGETKVHILSITDRPSDATTSTAYAILQDKAKEDGFTDATYTLKQACRLIFEDEHLDPTMKQKNYVRINSAPSKVYILCNDEEDANTKRVYNMWHEHVEDIETLNINPYARQNQLYYTENSKRDLATVWAKAIGWSFSGPIVRTNINENIDLFSARPDFKTLVKKDPNHTTRTLSNPRSYQASMRKVASDEEIDKFIAHIEFIASKANGAIDPYTYEFVGDTYTMSLFLDIDYKICEQCHKPRNIKADKDESSKRTKYSICPHCGKRYKHELTWYPYYDDTNADD